MLSITGLGMMGYSSSIVVLALPMHFLGWCGELCRRGRRILTPLLMLPYNILSVVGQQWLPPPPHTDAIWPQFWTLKNGV